MKHLSTRLFPILVVILVLFFSRCQKSNSNPGSTKTYDTYSFTCWNKIAGSITNFQSNNRTYAEHWDFGDGDTLMVPAGASSLGPQNHVYISPGIYTISLIVEDGSSAKVTQVDTIQPNYWFSYTGTPMVGETIFFHFPAFLPPSGVTYLWTFGDGTSSTDSIPNHIFNTSGTFVVKLTINGNPGNPDIYEQIPIYNDPIYTQQVTNMRLWHGTLHNYELPDTSIGSYYKTFDSTFALNFINEVTVSYGSENCIYNQSLSSGNIIVFSGFPSNRQLLNIYYDYIKDSAAVFSSYTELTGIGGPSIVSTVSWTSP